MKEQHRNEDKEEGLTQRNMNTKKTDTVTGTDKYMKHMTTFWHYNMYHGTILTHLNIPILGFPLWWFSWS